ncbi:MAG: hypothetical protein ACI9LO_001621 [Planctomycetota bacterium]|jgi:uncharacterized protein YehS (DUF1456 family)
MTNNDVLRRIRYTFDFGDDKMIAIFAQVDCEVNREQVSNWLKKDDDDDFQAIKDVELAAFLNGLIIDRRGKKPGEQPAAEKRLNNNIIFRKLKIALDYKDDDILAVMALADLRMSRHELSAFFRRAGHKHYRECKDQILRNFMKGMQIKYRKEEPSVSEESSVTKEETKKPEPID